MGSLKDPSLQIVDDKKNQPNIALDFDYFLPWACRQYSVEIDLVVTRAEKRECTHLQRYFNQLPNLTVLKKLELFNQFVKEILFIALKWLALAQLLQVC